MSSQSSFIGSYLPVLAEKILQICSSGGEESPLTQKFLPQLLRPILKESSGQKQDTDKILES